MGTRHVGTTRLATVRGPGWNPADVGLLSGAPVLGGGGEAGGWRWYMAIGVGDRSDSKTSADYRK